MYNRQKFLPIMLALFALSLMPVTLVTAPATASTKTQGTYVSKAINSAEILAPEMKIAKESDIFTSTGEIIYVWIAWYSDMPTLIVYSKEYNETTGAYQYTLTRIDSTGSMTQGFITILNWDVQWQIILNRSIVWGRISDIDGDRLPEIITIPDTRNLTVIYDDDGSELTSFEIPEYLRALVVTDWTNDGVDDVVLVEGAYTDIFGSYYLVVTVFDIYMNEVIELSPIYISGEFYVDEAFPGDWNLSTTGANDILLIDWVYAKCLILSSDGSASEVITLTDDGFVGDYIALHTSYVALSFYDSTYDADGIAIIYNGSLLWKYLLPSDTYLTSLQIVEIDGDQNPELIATTSDDVRIFDIEKSSIKNLITIDDWSYYAVVPLDFDIDGIFETVLINDLGWNQLCTTPFSEIFCVPYWEPYVSVLYRPCKLFNSTSVVEISNVSISDNIPNIVYLTSEDFDGDSFPELIGIYSTQSQTLAIYSVTEGVPPTVKIVSPADGNWVRSYVSIKVSVSDKHSGIYTVELLIDGKSLGYFSPPNIYWNASGYPEGTYSLTVIAYDNVNNTAADSIIVHLDNTPPTISKVQYPQEVEEGTNIIVSITTNDELSGIDKVILSYSTDGGKTWNNVTATSIGEDVYQATIPAQPADTQVQFKIYVYDVAGNVATSEVYSCKVVPKLVSQVPLAVIITGAGAIAALAATMIIIKRRMTK
ncbi:MAG: Ig-like domain-containing protein [Candidatus Baldrarchaeia archaeon]